MHDDVFIIAATRTPIGSLGGKLAPLSATALGAFAIKGSLEKAGLDKTLVDEVYMGNVLSANVGQAPARQAAIMAGLPAKVICTTVNKVCASGLKAIALSARAIIGGDGHILVAGGMESMSNVPFYVPKARFGYNYGNGVLVDGLARDGLTDAYNESAMGLFADQMAASYGISRKDQDDYAIQSYKRSAEAASQGLFDAEIIPVKVPDKKSEGQLVTVDEEFSRVNFEKIPSLRPVFSPTGTATAANASTINDGAAALVLASATKANELGIKPLARIISFADAEQEPSLFTTTPILATKKVLDKAGLTLDDIDYFEVNEAFSAVALAYIMELGLNPEKVNVHGGAVSLGHPLGASGARILVTLAHILRLKNARYGLAAICNGGGGASAMIIERA